MDYEEEAFRIFSDRMSRGRWYLTASTFLACLALCFMYLEQFSYQTNQFTETYKERALNDPTATLDSLLCESTCNPDSLKRIEAAQKYGILNHRYVTTSNALRNSTMEFFEIPILGLKVYGNDFLPIVSLMATLFLVMKYLNVQSVQSCLAQLDLDNPKLNKVVRLKFTFTGLQPNPYYRFFTVIFQFILFSIPAIAICSACYIDYKSIYETVDSHTVIGHKDDLYIRIQVLKAFCIAIAALTLMTIYRVYRINRLAFARPAVP